MPQSRQGDVLPTHVQRPAIQTAGIPLNFPIELGDGVLKLETTVPQAKLSTLGETVDSLDISYTVERIQQETESEEPLLTDRRSPPIRRIARGQDRTASAPGETGRFRPWWRGDRTP